MNYLRLARAVRNFATYAKAVDQIPQIDGVEICLDEPDPMYIHVLRNGATIFTLTLVSNVWKLETSEDVLTQLEASKMSGESWATLFFDRYHREYERHGLDLRQIPIVAVDPGTEEFTVSVGRITDGRYHQMQTGKHRQNAVDLGLDMFFHITNPEQGSGYLTVHRNKHRDPSQLTKHVGFGGHADEIDRNLFPVIQYQSPMERALKESAKIETRSATRDLVFGTFPLAAAERYLEKVGIDHTLDAARQALIGSMGLPAHLVSNGRPDPGLMTIGGALYSIGSRPIQADFDGDTPHSGVGFNILGVKLRRQRQELVHKGTPIEPRKGRYSKGIQRITLRSLTLQQDCVLTVYEKGVTMVRLAVPSRNSTEVYYFHGSTARMMMSIILRKPYIRH